MSFKATVDIMLSSRSDFMAFGGQTRNLRNYRERFLEICATKTLDIRPFRSEPRAVKRRPKSYQLLTNRALFFKKSNIAQLTEKQLNQAPFRSVPLFITVLSSVFNDYKFFSS